jgi:hypothetical protein
MKRFSSDAARAAGEENGRNASITSPVGIRPSAL